TASRCAWPCCTCSPAVCRSVRRPQSMRDDVEAGTGRPLLLRGGRVIDPAADRDGIADVLVRDGRIGDVAAGLDAPDDAVVIDAAGLVVCPGLIDLHVHLREPGQEHKET